MHSLHFLEKIWEAQRMYEVPGREKFDGRTTSSSMLPGWQCFQSHIEPEAVYVLWNVYKGQLAEHELKAGLAYCKHITAL